MKFPTQHIAVILFLALAPLCRAADPITQPTTAPASQPTTQPASQPAPAPALDPKAVVQLFLTGILTGDEKSVFGNLAFSSEDARKEANAVVGEALAQQQLDAVLTEAFEKPQPGEPTPEDLKKELIDGITKQVAASHVTEKDDTAEVAVDKGPTISLLRQDGTWKVDFDKTQRANDGPADKAAIATAAGRVKVYKQMIADVKAAKFRTAKEANDELKNRIANLPK